MRSEYLFELGGENIELGKFEANEVLKTEKYDPKLKFEEDNSIILNVSKVIEPRTISRLGMTKRVSKIFHSANYKKDINKVINKINFLDIGRKSFAIRLITKKKISENKIAIKLGEKIPEKNKTNLKKPDVKILFYVGERIIISIYKSKIDTSYKKCLKHHIKYRPYFSPISIHPRIARAMVNLANCSVNDTVIDPFCGTGGILIEAADMNLKIIGSDILPKMVENTKGNLKHFKFKGKIIESDVRSISKLKFNAIVCDPPYGISTTTKGEKISDLMNRTMDTFTKNLIKGQRVIMAISKPELIKTSEFRLKKQFKWYIHKSLTRNILILEKN